MKVIREPARDIPVVNEVDVVVTGGGPAGIMAAIAAARQGAKTVLIEQKGFLGGNASLGLPFLGFHDDKNRQLVGGIAWELIERLKAEGASPGPWFHKTGGKYNAGTSICFDVPMFFCFVNEMMAEASVQLFLHTLAVAPVLENNSLKGVFIESKSGRQAISSGIVIDASGDADIAVRAGAAFEKGNPENGFLQPSTLLFKASGVNIKELMADVDENPGNYHFYDSPGLWKYYQSGIRMDLSGCEKICAAATGAGDYDVPNPYVIFTCLPGNGEILVNMAKIKGLDGSNNLDLTKGETEGRTNIRKVMNFLRKYIKGFENAYVDWISPAIGIRETRRIIGEYVLNENDMISRKKFEDRICMGGRYVDIHDPTPDNTGKSKYIIFPEGYYIPYRCLIPKKINNLLVAGRCISVNHVAYGSTRVMAQCMATGQAAGTAAALALKTNSLVRNIDIDKLRNTLRRDKAIID